MTDTKTVIDRSNEVFLRHAPDGLAELFAEDCVLETIEGGPDGRIARSARYGKAA